MRLLATERPDDAILGEEGSAGNAASPNVWIVDPLDGTSNYAHGFPIYCVSVGYAEKGQLVAGAVYDPLRDELFTATRGDGAYLNGAAIAVSDAEAFNRAMVFTGLQTDDADMVSQMLAQAGRLVNAARAVRSPGCPALSLCYVASGRCEAFCHGSLEPWDVAAGALIVQEAGGTATTYDGSDFPLDRGTALAASNGRLHARLLELIAG